MAISEQFKSLNLTQKILRKLCTDEVGGVQKNHVLQFKKNYFLYCSFWLAPSALHFKDDL